MIDRVDNKDVEKIFNRYFDEDGEKYVKVEPIMKFIKK
jgi:hypothetical protein